LTTKRVRSGCGRGRCNRGAGSARTGNYACADASQQGGNLAGRIRQGVQACELALVTVVTECRRYRHHSGSGRWLAGVICVFSLSPAESPQLRAPRMVPTGIPHTKRSYSAGQVKSGQHLGGAEPNYELAGYAVALPKLLGQVWPHIARGDHCREADEFATVLRQLGCTLHLHEGVWRFSRSAHRLTRGWRACALALGGFEEGVEDDVAVLDDEPVGQ
jgi:hypothetical protein